MNRLSHEPAAAEVRRLLGAMAGRRIAVLGDAMLDVYLQGPVARISPEAPVPVLEVQRAEYKLGGAANVAACLAALGADVRLLAVVGDDDEGARLTTEARRCNMDVSSLLVDPRRPTTCKTRVVARNQQLVRLDREMREPLDGAIERLFLEEVTQAASWADGLVLSDYAKGALTPNVCQRAIQAAASKAVVVDPKQLPWDRYHGASLIKPNRAEAEQFAGIRLSDDGAALQAARQIAERLSVSTVLITRGEAGMTLLTRAQNHESREVRHFPVQRRELVDVTGAGDVVAAVLTLALATSAEVEDATWLSNLAAGIKVGKFGAAAITPDEILQSLDDEAPSFVQKVMSRADAAALAASLRRRGQRVVFTNGCFDLLHLGHVTYLERSRRLGDFLIVGVNSDASVRQLKGATRPVQSEADRAQILAAQGNVDAVVVFEEDTPLELIRAVRPDVLTKGADYGSKEAVVGWQLVEGWGGCVVLLDLVAGRSTTSLLDRAA